MIASWRQMDPWFAAPLGFFIAALLAAFLFGCVYAVDWWLWEKRGGKEKWYRERGFKP